MQNSQLVGALLAQLKGQPLADMAQSLGISSEQTESAVATALPLLLAALGQNASQPQGAAELFSALSKDHSQAASGNGLGDLLGGLAQQLLAGNSGQNQAAGGILGHIFGNKLPQAEAQLGQATGLSTGLVDQLLKLLAPVVMAFLAKQVMSGGMNANDLGKTLGAEKAQIQQQGGLGSVLGGLLDQDGDGQFGLSDLVKLGSGFLSKR